MNKIAENKWNWAFLTFLVHSRRAQNNFEKKEDNLQRRQPLCKKTSMEDDPNSWKLTKLDFQLNVYSHKAQHNMKRWTTVSSIEDDLNI
jgi:hypothetical protein